MNPGTIVRCRNRDWVLLPSQDHNLYLLRPLAGTVDDVVAVHRRLADLIGYQLPEERVDPSRFPPPSADEIGDAQSAQLLWQAARLTLREGATPFRSLGRISIRPRIYQLVPLLMALRLDPVRLFIADDVGVGKTIEALLVARELWDRGEIQRLAVLCPPYLCEQWAAELEQKFSLEPVVIRSGTVTALERRIPSGKSIYEHFPVQVISIDWVKSDRNKHQFIHFCPELVIVDEVHGAAEASSQSRGQQERHQLLRQVADNPRRHLILLTATPHSGVEEAFRSLLGLLNSEFATWNFNQLDETKRAHLARHFVQRTRKDIQNDWEGEACFPVRETTDETYELSRPYSELFRQTYAFCSEIVRTGQHLEERKRRVRYWGALALLRCVMSSPAAAMAALEKRMRGQQDSDEEDDYRPFIFESAEDQTEDETPIPPLEAAETTLPESERRRLRELLHLAKALDGGNNDTKLMRCVEVVRHLLDDGFHPIVWCRYVATAKYVGEHLRRLLPEDVQVVTITGRMGDDERRLKIQDISPDLPRVLVATDCLSEGINLQDKFTAVLHYDLPWNPNRLEQREGRVDRYGQTANRVKAIRFYGRDNPVDGIVIRVLLDKASEIHRTLGTHVPVPEESESVMQAILNALFLRRKSVDGWQLQIPMFELEEVEAFHRKWERDAERERSNRTRFAQRALKPEEVRRELEATDSVLGDPEAVRRFVLAAAQRLGMQIYRHPTKPHLYRVPISEQAMDSLPEPIRFAIPRSSPAGRSQGSIPTRRSSPEWLISFISPTPEGAEYLGRNHPFVAALARYLLEEALTAHRAPTEASKDGPSVARCGVIRTRSVSRLTTLILLRVRYLVERPDRPALLSEEVVLLGYRKPGPNLSREAGSQEHGHAKGAAGDSTYWLPDHEVLGLLEARPDANIPLAEKRELAQAALKEIGAAQLWEPTDGPPERWGTGHPIQEGIRQQILRRASELEESHKRLRRAVDLQVRGLSVRPHLPPDLLGILVLQPVVTP